ncbi:hypothetical protein Q757_09765 [Oenococcus alcoholitolerans]|uniref:Uncharacterized protein n=1 Tax=Oenococcus alcoholitolerans TaxID=931074 RepID=A0ABR4XPU6_9LACO|nr:hypothetical protein Q757_09765 [Oenococcus alcoholitolerans]
MISPFSAAFFSLIESIDFSASLNLPAERRTLDFSIFSLISFFPYH